MFVRRCIVMAIAAGALAGCASGSHYSDDDYYGTYYGGRGIGYEADHDHHRYFRPERGVICDRERDLCYDHDGPSQEATRRYFGDRNYDQDRSPGGRPAIGLTPKGYDRKHDDEIWPTDRQGMADHDHDGRPVGVPRMLNPNGKDTGGGGGMACPPTGCR